MARHIDEKVMWERVHANLYVFVPVTFSGTHLSIYPIYNSKQALETINIFEHDKPNFPHFSISLKPTAAHHLTDSDLGYEW